MQGKSRDKIKKLDIIYYKRDRKINTFETFDVPAVVDVVE